MSMMMSLIIMIIMSSSRPGLFIPHCYYPLRFRLTKIDWTTMTAFWGRYSLRDIRHWAYGKSHSDADCCWSSAVSSIAGNE